MRIQIKVYIDAEKDQDCSGVKPDFWVSAGSFDEVNDQLADLIIPVSRAREGIPPEQDPPEPDTNDPSQFPAEASDMKP